MNDEPTKSLSQKIRENVAAEQELAAAEEAVARPVTMMRALLAAPSRGKDRRSARVGQAAARKARTRRANRIGRRSAARNRR